MKLIVPFAAILLSTALSFGVFAQSSVSIKRSNYKGKIDDGGVYDFHHGISTFQKNEIKAMIRDFVWSHWTQRKKGKIGFRRFTIEGDPTTTVFFVNKTNKNDWQVELIFEEKCCWFQRRPTRTSKTRYGSVSRVELITDASASEIPKTVADDVVRKGDTFAIKLIAVRREDDFLY